MCIHSDTDTLMRKRSRTRQACPNCVGGQGSIYNHSNWTKEFSANSVTGNDSPAILKNLQISDDVVGHIKFNEVIRNITEIQFRSK